MSDTTFKASELLREGHAEFVVTVRLIRDRRFRPGIRLMQLGGRLAGMAVRAKDSTGDAAYYVGTHRYGFRVGQAAEITGVRVVTPPGMAPRACFELPWPDGRTDVSPIDEPGTYRIGTKTDLEIETP